MEFLSSGAKSLTAGQVSFSYYELGEPTGMPLVLFHGFPDAPVAWESVVKALDAKKYRIVIPYLRGFGETKVLQEELVGGQTAALGEDLLALTDALGMRRFHVVGHDWGAMAGYAAAVLAPERILSLMTLATPYLLWKGELLPPTQVRAKWYHFYFQLEPAKQMLAEHRNEFCEELWRIWSPEWKFSAKQFAAAAAAWESEQFTPIVLDYYRKRWGVHWGVELTTLRRTSSM